MPSLTPLFSPASIAVVGVSQDPSKVGSIVYQNILEAGFAGDVYPVNPKYDQIGDTPCFSSLKSLPKPPELVAIAVPADRTPDLLLEAAQAGAKAAIIYAAGFSEVGEEGAALEAELVAIAQKHDLTLLGPNTLGLLVPGTQLNASFAGSQLVAGDIAVMSQSGAYCTALQDMSLATGVGFSHLVSLGNKAALNEQTLLEYWLEDKHVKALGAYLESIDDGKEFVRTYALHPERKPLVVIKPGKSTGAQRAMSSHTASLASPSTLIETALEQHGIIQVDTVRELFNQLMCFSWSPLPAGPRTAILTNAGGAGIVSTDELEAVGLSLATLDPNTREALAAQLPASASTHNPVDVMGDAPAQRYQTALELLLTDPGVDAVLLLLTPQQTTQITQTAAIITEAARTTEKPIFPVFIGGTHVAAGLQWLWAHRIPAFSEQLDAAQCLARMLQFSQKKPRPTRSSQNTSHTPHPKLTTLLKTAPDATGVISVPDALAHQLLDAAGIVLPQQVLVHSLDAAEEFAKHHWPVVLKAPSESIEHKTEARAVYTQLHTRVSLAQAWDALTQLVPAPLLIQEHVSGLAEIFVGIQRDGDAQVYHPNGLGFGHLLTVGAGGIYTEVYQDVAHVLLPATADELLDTLKKTRVFKILTGARGKKSLAYYKLIDQLSAFQTLVLTHPEIVSLDCNPILIDHRRAVAVDVKLQIKK